MLRRFIPVWLSGLVLLGAAGSAAAGAGPIFVTGPDFPPFSDPALPEGGMSSLVVKRVYELLGKPATIEFLPWRRGYEETAAHKFAGTFPYVATAERERLFLFSEPLSASEQVVYMNAKNAFAFAGPDDLAGKTVCNELGSGLPREVEAMAADGRVRIESPSTLSSCIRMLSAGRVDVLIRNRLTGDAAIRATGVAAGSVVAAATPYAIVRHHLLMPRTKAGAEAAMAEFNAGLARLRASGELDRIVARYTLP